MELISNIKKFFQSHRQIKKHMQKYKKRILCLTLYTTKKIKFYGLRYTEILERIL